MLDGAVQARWVDVKFASAIALLRARTYELLAFALPCLIFLLSASRDVASWDTAEMQGVPYILGIPHPTGFPAYVLLGYLFSHLLPFGSVAFRLNAFSALCVAGACVASYLTAKELGAPKACAVVSAWWFAVAGVVWSHAIRAEVHDLALFFASLTVVYVLRWQRLGDARDFLFGIAAFALGIATHPLAIWLLPGIFFACALRRPNKALAVRGALITLAGIATYAYLPIRSFAIVHQHLDPTIGLAGQHGALFWNLNDPSTWSGLVTEVTGSQFGAGHTILAALNTGVMQAYLWNWMTMVNAAYGAYGIILAFIGLGYAWSRDWKSTVLLLLLCLAAVPFSYAYANVEGDSDRYRLMAIWLVPVLMACAAVSKTVDSPRLLRTGVVLALSLLWCAETFQNNRAIMSNRVQHGSRNVIAAAAQEIPPGALVVTPWLDATTLSYGAYVDKSFQGRVIIAGWPNEEERHFASWIKRYPIYVIWNTPPARYAGVRFVEQHKLRTGQFVWRVKRNTSLDNRVPTP